MPLTAGTRLGPYEILSLVGAGGMGEVYRARDSRLERTVAIKVLPPDRSRSTDVRQRFEREAKAIAKLSHPHICAIYDVGREGEIEYLVMELLEGETLAERLAKGPVPLPQAMRFGVEIAGALEKAHRQGIVHRDLKPGNVMLTKSGVKPMDSGLARAFSPAAPAGPLSARSTELKPLTSEGTILGTLQYMAPEQLEGKETDARADIFAFGATLYEMVTGRKAFAGATQASLISGIMQNDPAPISSILPVSPPTLDRIVRTCLAKDPDERWQNAGDVARELGWIGGEATERVAASLAPAARSSRRNLLPWAVAALAILLAAAALLWPRRMQTPGELTRFAILPPPGQIFFGLVALSPDARRVLFQLQDDAGRDSVWVRSLDSLEMRRLQGTEESRGMFWSPDGREIAFFSGGKLRRMAAEGGPAQTICESGGAFAGAWSRDGTILFVREWGDPVVAVPAAGGAPRPVTVIDAARGEQAHSSPAFLPDGRHFLYAASFTDHEKTRVMLASLDSKEVRPLFLADSSALFSDRGYLLFGRNGAIFASRFDLGSLKLVSEPVPVFDEVRVLREDNYLAASAAGNRLVYLTWVGRRRLVWVDRKGREVGALGEVGDYTDVRISPEGQRVAVARRDASSGLNQDLWVLDVGRATSTRVTFDPSEEFDPAWYPDGRRLVYVTDHGGVYDVYETAASGGAPKLLLSSKKDKVLPKVSPDGRQLLVTVNEGAQSVSVLFPVSGQGQPVRLSDGRFSEQHPEFSPDGRWVTFDSNESGAREVYVEPVPAGPRRQVSIGGGQMAVWNRNGSELFYVARDGMLMLVMVRQSAGKLETGEPQPLFPLGLGIAGELPWHRHPYDVSPDGQRFLVIRRAPDAEPVAAVVVTNWTAVLRGGR